jgi:hypothetical protein
MLQLVAITKYLHTNNIAFTSNMHLTLCTITVNANDLSSDAFNFLCLQQKFKYSINDTLCKTFN